MKKDFTNPYVKKCAYCDGDIDTRTDYFVHSPTNNYYMHMECFNNWHKDMQEEIKQKEKAVGGK